MGHTLQPQFLFPTHVPSKETGCPTVRVPRKENGREKMVTGFTGIVPPLSAAPRLRQGLSVADASLSPAQAQSSKGPEICPEGEGVGGGGARKWRWGTGKGRACSASMELRRVLPVKHCFPPEQPSSLPAGSHYPRTKQGLGSRFPLISSFSVFSLLHLLEVSLSVSLVREACHPAPPPRLLLALWPAVVWPDLRA